MSLNAQTINANLTLDTTKNLVLTSRIQSSAGSAMNLCERSIHRFQPYLRGVVSILLISNLRHTALSRTYVNVLGGSGTLSARSPQGFNSRLKGVARELAVVIGISLSMASMPSSQASIVPNKSMKNLANYQLTDELYKCHNEIIFRESSWNINAVNGSHYGYYQMKIDAMKGKPYDYQFYTYWYYVSKRYGFDKTYEELPNYCKALHHLKSKGWQ